jgi:hypothetical protein
MKESTKTQKGSRWIYEKKNSNFFLKGIVILYINRVFEFLIPRLRKPHVWMATTFVGLALVGKEIVFRFIIEYSSLRDFGPY